MALLALIGITADSGKICVVKDFSDEKHSHASCASPKPRSKSSAVIAAVVDSSKEA